jgi:hypothetical protein
LEELERFQTGWELVLIDPELNLQPEQWKPVRRVVGCFFKIRIISHHRGGPPELGFWKTVKSVELR